MASIALFHSVLGVRPGIRDAADRLRADGHQVLVVDQFDGRVFDDYDEAGRHTEQIGFPELMRRALDAVAGLPDGFVAAGFSNGAGMAEHVATERRCGSAPVQVHATIGDPMRHQEWYDAFAAEVSASGAGLEVFDYRGDGHLFTDPDLPEEYDAAAAALAWERALAFCRSVDAATGVPGT